MIVIKEVKTKKEQKAFMQFPIDLYKDSPYYVPVLFMDEKKIFRPDYIYNETCDVVFYLAYKDNIVVGRISGIIQKAANLKWNQQRVRFTRFDAINDQEVANALFDAVIEWAKKQGMKEIVGPLGYSDLEREGLLIEGFEELGTYEEQYNYEYYQHLIDNYGFQKEVDWLECKLYAPKEKDERLATLSRKMLDRYHLTMSKPKSIRWFLKHHVYDFFDIIDETYDHIYGTVPFTKKMVNNMIDGFKSLGNPNLIGMIHDENGKMVGFAMAFPSISEAVNKSKGHITLPFIFRFLKARRHPKVIDMGLIGVLKQYESRGVATGIISCMQDIFEEQKVEHMETNLILEYNHHMLNLTKNFDREFNKRRRCYVKEI